MKNEKKSCYLSVWQSYFFSFNLGLDLGDDRTKNNNRKIKRQSAENGRSVGSIKERETERAIESLSD